MEMLVDPVLYEWVPCGVVEQYLRWNPSFLRILGKFLENDATGHLDDLDALCARNREFFKQVFNELRQKGEGVDAARRMSLDAEHAAAEEDGSKVVHGEADDNDGGGDAEASGDDDDPDKDADATAVVDDENKLERMRIQWEDEGGGTDAAGAAKGR